MVKIVEPSVEIIGDINGKEILQKIERAARTCYKTEGNITSDGESAKKMIRKLIDMNHTAMLEFADVHVLLRCDVGVYKDLTRHRHCSFAIESTRYCNYSKDKFGNEITFIRPVNMENKEGNPIYEEFLSAMRDMEKHYMKMAKLGCKPDQLRMILPHSTAAYVNIKANIREWRHIFGLRCDKAAHPSVRQIMLMTLNEFHKRIPLLFDDLYNKYKDDMEEFGICNDIINYDNQIPSKEQIEELLKPIQFQGVRDDLTIDDTLKIGNYYIKSEDALYFWSGDWQMLEKRNEF